MKRLAEIKGGLTLHFKLLCYFLVFGAIILVVLWVFQSFLLKPYYTAKKSNIVEKSAARIVRAIEQNKNIWTTVDNVASYNSLTVYLYDTESVMGFTTPIYEINYDNPAAQLTIEPHEVYSYYRYAKNGDGTYMCVDSNSLDDIARQKLERLRKAFTGATSDSTPEVHYRSGATNNVENMVYAAVASRSEGDEMFVLVTSSITPLTMITGYGEVMRDLPGENTPENIQIIIDEATRLSTLVNDLLDLSKLQSGALQAEKKEFCLTDSVRDIFTRYAKLVEQDGYNIIFEAYENVYINADELRISQVIYNLVNNAVNHVGEDKTVIVTQKPQKGGKVRIEVTDHGEGIPADKLEYIWERYYKVDKEHKRGVIGSGLGLSIVKSILDAHNAHYGVRSALGKGSTFWFEIAATRIEKTNL